MNHWLKALLAAFITGAATALTGAIVDPTDMDPAKLQRAGITALAAGLLGAVTYLLKSPLPIEDPAPAKPDVQTPGPGAGTVAKLLITGLAIGLLTGCAGTSADQDFRSKVKSVNVGGTVTSDGRQTTGGFTTTFEFRDPTAAGLSK